jgi:hypothetical protein
VEVGMTEANTNLVERELSELTQQIIHVIQPQNEEKDILQEAFNYIKNKLSIMES